MDDITTLAEQLNTSDLDELDLNDTIPLNYSFIPIIRSLSNKSITKLNLSNNIISNSNMIELNTVLKTNSVLTHLYLSNINSGELMFGLNILLNDWLKTNNTLVYLDLSSNHIDNNMIETLCKSIKTKKSLQSLILNNNMITINGAIILYHTILDSNIVELNLDNNDIDYIYTLLIQKRIKNNIYMNTFWSSPESMYIFNQKMCKIMNRCLLYSKYNISLYLPNELWIHIFSYLKRNDF